MPTVARNTQTDYRRYERDGKVCYFHKTADGKWCKEK
jgi:hypothetical protein